MNQHVIGEYLKALLAIAGAAVTSALSIFPAHTTNWEIATVAAAAISAALVYIVPNAAPPAK